MLEKDCNGNLISSFPPCYAFHMIFTTFAPRLIQSIGRGQYPALWKKEYVTPVPKVKEPETMKDVRKIACTSDFNKLFQGYLKDILIEDVRPNIDCQQYGGRKKIGTEHMVVAMIYRVLSLLDKPSPSWPPPTGSRHLREETKQRRQ